MSDNRQYLPSTHQYFPSIHQPITHQPINPSSHHPINTSHQPINPSILPINPSTHPINPSIHVCYVCYVHSIKNARIGAWVPGRAVPLCLGRHPWVPGAPPGAPWEGGPAQSLRTTFWQATLGIASKFISILNRCLIVLGSFWALSWESFSVVWAPLSA